MWCRVFHFILELVSYLLLTCIIPVVVVIRSPVLEAWGKEKGIVGAIFFFLIGPLFVVSVFLVRFNKFLLS